VLLKFGGLTQADDGYLYPLDRAFFYIHKPPTLLVHDEIESIEFMRQGGGVLAASAKTFDLNIRMKTDNKLVLLLIT
jgi:structure-specific recognition protein 1